MTATAYDNSYASTGKYPGQAGYGLTASGTYARPGTVADSTVLASKNYLYVVVRTPDRQAYLVGLSKKRGRQLTHHFCCHILANRH